MDFIFYENIEVGLGDYLLDTIFADIDSLELDAGIHVKRYGKYHCLLSKTFSSAIYYPLAEDTVCIRAVLDCRQNPGRTFESLK